MTNNLIKFALKGLIPSQSVSQTSYIQNAILFLEILENKTIYDTLELYSETRILVIEEVSKIFNTLIELSYNNNKEIEYVNKYGVETTILIEKAVEKAEKILIWLKNI